MGDLGDADGLWTNCAASIRAQVSDAVWRTTFSGAKAVAFDEGELVLVVPNGLQKERIEGRYLGLVQDAIEESAADEIAVRVEIETDWSESPTEIDVPTADRRAVVAGGGGFIRDAGSEAPAAVVRLAALAVEIAGE